MLLNVFDFGKVNHGLTIGTAPVIATDAMVANEREPINTVNVVNQGCLSPDLTSNAGQKNWEGARHAAADLQLATASLRRKIPTLREGSRRVGKCTERRVKNGLAKTA